MWSGRAPKNECVERKRRLCLVPLATYTIFSFPNFNLRGGICLKIYVFILHAVYFFLLFFFFYFIFAFTRVIPGTWYRTYIDFYLVSSIWRISHPFRVDWIDRIFTLTALSNIAAIPPQTPETVPFHRWGNHQQIALLHNANVNRKKKKKCTHTHTHVNTNM